MIDGFNSKSFAVIGASRDITKVGHVVFKNLTTHGIKAYPVNPNANEILGKKCYKSLNDIKEKVECIVVCIKADFVPEVLEQAGKKGIKSAIVISSGFSEAGDNKLDTQIKEICDKYKIALLGPNTLGFINPYHDVNASFFDGMPKKGKIAFLSQSGAIGAAILDMGFPLSGFVSLGNMTILDFSDFIDYFSKDKNTDVICLYIESLKKDHGKKFIEVCKNCKKPIFALKSGKSESGKKAAMSHTAALASVEGVYEGIFKQCGIIEVESIKQLLKGSELITKYKKIGSRTCIITNAGGLGVLSSDYCTKNGIEIPKLPENVKNKLSEFLPKGWSHNNPVDILGDAHADLYEKTLRTLEKENFFDFFIVLLTPQYMTEPLKTAEAIFKVKGKPVVTCFMGEEKVEHARKYLRGKIMAFTELKEMAEVLGKIVEK